MTKAELLQAMKDLRKEAASVETDSTMEDVLGLFDDAIEILEGDLE